MSVEDEKRELHELALRYARACDTHDAEEFAAIFTEDGEIVSPGHTMTGRDQIVAVVLRVEQKQLRRRPQQRGVAAFLAGDGHGHKTIRVKGRMHF